MNGSRRSIPFHVTLLTLMALIVLPLAAALLWLGWRAVDQLEDRSVAIAWPPWTAPSRAS
jgi:adenylate cyclase